LAKNEEGEFELILGNRQLISVFLIVVILLGIFFSMGYIVGRNSAPTNADTARNSKPPEVTSPNQDNTASTSPAPASPPAETTPAPPAKSTHPARTETEPSPPPAPVAKLSKPSPTPTPARPAPSDAGEPGPGDYWQVVATARPDAEIITETLTKKGFHAIMAPAPKDGIFRVLVGPLKDSSSQAQARTDLEAAGFKNPIVRKY
jgi:cell division septation protein DedD